MPAASRAAPYPALLPGDPSRLGATARGDGVNFALFSAHAEAVTLCLFSRDGRDEIARHAMVDRTDGVWHGFLPGAGPGTVYGYRVDGPWAPIEGHRFNPAKLLLDPYARALAGAFIWHDAVHGHVRGSRDGDLLRDDRDSAPYVFKAIVATEPAAPSPPLRRPWRDLVIYEASVRGLTMRHPDIPAEDRGTFRALGHPAVTAHLAALGVTALELMPVFAFLDERALVMRGLRNAWGYNTTAFFATHPPYGTTEDLARAVERLHAAGIEVILDVVYNHTAESDEHGPTVSFRGIDNRSYYRHSGVDWRRPDNPTGTGNALALHRAPVLRMVMDSLRYWVDRCGIDGFRYDLAPVLGRTENGFRADAGFFTAIHQDPVLSRVKHIAEPWDIGPGGYRLGAFPPGWSEWNDQFRDTVRRFWRGDVGMRPRLAGVVSGSAGIFERSSAPGHGAARRGPSASINFVTAHDGFTLADLVSYARKHNEANGEGNRDGTDHNYSDNLGVEGPSDDPEIRARRDLRRRSLLATLMLAQGVPMILGGDEIGRSQAGNNNAYCQDGETTWLDWSRRDPALEAWIARLSALRRAHPSLRRPHYLHGQHHSVEGWPDIAWYRPDGAPMGEADWHLAQGHALAVLLGGAAGPDRNADGTPRTDQPLMILFNACPSAMRFDLPAEGWRLRLDAARPEVEDEPVAGPAYRLAAGSVALLLRDRPA